MTNLPAAPAPAVVPPASAVDAGTLQQQAITGLRAIIYGAGTSSDITTRPLPADHDPILRQRSAAVELLGHFPDATAARLLGEVLQQGTATIPPPAGRWLRDTALLTLLRSHRLPEPEVDRALRGAYSIVRHPLPWQWSAVYDDLPLLARYRKLDIFFWAFWIWPLLLGALPTLIFARQLLFPSPLDTTPLWVSILVLLGCGAEIYLVHQVVLALLAGTQGPVILPGGGSAHRKGWWGAGLTVVMLGVVLLILWGMASGAFTERNSPGLIALRLTALGVPLLLLPMFMLAHDLEQVVRYTRRGTYRRLRLWTGVLRRTTDGLYLLLLPLLATTVWSAEGLQLPLATLGFLAYLFAVPLFVTGGLRWLARRRTAAPPAIAAPANAAPAQGKEQVR